MPLDCSLKQNSYVVHYVQYNMTPMLCYSGVFGFSFIVIYTILPLSILIYAKLSRCKKKEQKISTPLFYMTLLFYASLCIGFAIQIYTLISFGEFFISENPFRQILWIHYIFDYIFTMTGYIIVVYQLYISLKGSMLALSSRLIGSHAMVLILATLCSIARFILYKTNHFTSARYAGAFMIFITFCGLFHISCTFDRKLYLFIVRRTASVSTCKIDVDQSHYKRMFEVITKISILMSIMIVFGLFHIMVSIVDGLTSGHELIVLFIYSHMIYVFVLSLCIFLTVPLNEKIYFMLCSTCHDKCIVICKSLATTSATKRFQMTQSIQSTARQMTETIQKQASEKHVHADKRDVDEKILNAVDAQSLIVQDLDDSDADSDEEEQSERYDV
eukprot:13377_1